MLERKEQRIESLLLLGTKDANTLFESRLEIEVGEKRDFASLLATGLLFLLKLGEELMRKANEWYDNNKWVEFEGNPNNLHTRKSDGFGYEARKGRKTATPLDYVNIVKDIIFAACAERVQMADRNWGGEGGIGIQTILNEFKGPKAKLHEHYDHNGAQAGVVSVSLRGDRTL
eukprot:gene10332-21603_t